MDIAQITIKTLTPVVLTAPGSSTLLTSSSDSFSGTLLRGIFAGEYIQKHHLGHEAQEDKNFITYFFDKLRFLPANPAVQGKRSYVLPLSLMKAKKTDVEKPLLDLLADTPAPGYKKLSGLAYVDDAGRIQSASVKRSMNFHMSRSSQQERLGGHSQDGKVYTYESLDAGQTFIGAILGDSQTLQALFDDLGHDGAPFTCRVGRSKHTAYGKCQLTFQKPQEIAWPELPQDVVLRLDSPLVPVTDPANQAEKVLTKEVAQRLNEMTGSPDFSVGQVFGAAQSIENFVRIWGMRRPYRKALAAGTVFALHKEGPWQDKDKQALFQLMYGGVGLLTEEGFGQLRLWQHGDLSLAASKTQETKIFAVPIQTKEVKDRVALILRKTLQEKLQALAYDDAQKLQGLSGKSKTHTFARLETFLGSRTDGKNKTPTEKKDAFLRHIQNDVAPKEPMENHLREIKLGHTSLYEFFTSSKTMPYEAEEKKANLDKLLPQKLLQETGLNFTDDDYFYDYWLWLFRHGRKQAVQANKEKEV